jgi:hypothetical protein
VSPLCLSRYSQSEKAKNSPTPVVEFLAVKSNNCILSNEKADSSFQLDSIIAGLLNYPPNLLVLSYGSATPTTTPSTSEVDLRRRPSPRPELRIISSDKEELSSDALSLKEYERLQAGDYSLQWNEKSQCVYIVSPSDIVIGWERTAEDRVQWLLDRGKYREALDVFETKSSGGDDVGKWNRKEIGVKYIEHLIEEGISPGILTQDNGRKQQIERLLPSAWTQTSGKRIYSSSPRTVISTKLHHMSPPKISFSLP